MRIPVHLVSGWKRPLLVAAPITLAVSAVVGVWVYTSSTNAGAPPLPPAANPALDGRGPSKVIYVQDRLINLVP